MAKAPLTDAQRRIQRILDDASSTVIAYAAPEVPDLDNLTPQGLNEEFGRLNEARKSLEKTEKIVKERLRALIGDQRELRSDNYVYKREARPRYALDQETAKAKLLELGGQKALDECMKSSEVETVTIKPIQ